MTEEAVDLEAMLTASQYVSAADYAEDNANDGATVTVTLDGIGGDADGEQLRFTLAADGINGLTIICQPETANLPERLLPTECRNGIGTYAVFYVNELISCNSKCEE